MASPAASDLDPSDRPGLQPMPRRALTVMILGSACTFGAGLNLSIMYVAFPDLVESFPDATAAELSWIINVYTVVAAATLVLGGVVGDRWGRKRTILAGVTGFAAAAALCAVAPNPGVLILGRGLQGLFGSLIIPTSVTLILEEVPVERRASAVAGWSATGSTAAAAGPTLGALLIDAGGWPWAFWVSVPIAFVVVPLGMRVFHESYDPHPRPFPDPLSMLFLVVGVSLVILALTQSDDWGWTDVLTLGSAASGLALLAALVVRSLRVHNPVVDLSLFAHASVRRAGGLSVVFGVGYFSMFFGAVLFARDVWGYSTIQSGLLVTPIPVLGAVVGGLGGRVADRRGHRPVVLTGAALFTVAAAYLALRVGEDPDLWGTWMPAIVAIGLGGALVWPSIHSSAVHGVPSNVFTAATAVNQTVQRVGTALGVAATITIVSRWRLGDGVGAYRGMFVLMAVSGLAAALVGTGLRTAPARIEVVAQE